MSDSYPNKLPTDAHEDRWNRLGLSSKKNDLKAVDIDERLDDYIGFSKHNLSGGLSFQNQTFKDLSKQEDKLKSFNQKILREFEDLKRMKYFPNQHHRFPVSNEPLANSFVINPEQITPALKASDDRIKALETEMDHRERDMVKMNGIVELLIEENKYLRDHISSKNRDISKILETVGLNDGETTHDLRHRLSLLSEENNILLAHLEELRAVKENFEKYTRDKNHELSRVNEEYYQARQSLEEALKREELLTNYKQMMDPKFRHSQEKVAQLEATVSDLIEELSQVKNQNVLMSNQIASYKKGLDEIDGKNALELDRLVQEVNVLQNEKKEHKKAMEAKDKILEDRQNELKKVRRDFEQTKLEFEEVVQVMNELKNQLANERQTTETAVKREKELRDRNNKLADELEKLQTKFSKVQDEHVHLIESMKVDYNARISKHEQKIQRLKAKLEDKEKRYKTELLALKTQSEDLARILETVSAEREDYYKRWEALSRESNLYGEREKNLIELDREVDRLSRELEMYKQELIDTENRYRAQNDDLRSESEKLNEINKRLREEIANYKAQYEETSTKPGTFETQRRRELGERDQNILSPSPTKRNFSDLEKENQYLQQMIKSLVSEDNNYFSTERGQPIPASAIRHNMVPVEQMMTPEPRMVVMEQPRPVEQVIHAPIAEHMVHRPVEVVHRPMEVVHRPMEVAHRPVEVVHHGPVEIMQTPQEHMFHRPVEQVLPGHVGHFMPVERPLTPINQQVYPTRLSMTASHERPRESVVMYTDVKQKENANVDTVISGILRKYNMEKIPDYVGKNKALGNPDYIRRDNFESTRDAGHASNVVNRTDLGGGVRSPQMQFLSPLLSSPKYESKTESLGNSVSRPEIERERLLSPEAIGVIESLKRGAV